MNGQPDETLRSLQDVDPGDDHEFVHRDEAPPGLTPFAPQNSVNVATVKLTLDELARWQKEHLAANPLPSSHQD